MQWSASEHEALLHLLSNVTSPDPLVQRANMAQVSSLADWPVAPFALIDVLGQAAYPVATRQAAALLLRQLLQTTPHVAQGLTNTSSISAAIISPLLGALADPLPAIRRSSALLAASLFPECWPSLPQTLHELSHQVLLDCQRGDHGEGVRERLIGIATCLRTLCEERTDALRQLVWSSVASCVVLGELCAGLAHTAAMLLASNGALAAAVVVAVLEAVQVCFSSHVLSASDTAVDAWCANSVSSGSSSQGDEQGEAEDSDELLESDSSTSTKDDSILGEVPSHVASCALRLNGVCCALIVDTAPLIALDATTILPVMTSYVTVTLSWESFWTGATERATTALLPHVLQCIDRRHVGYEVQLTVRSLDFIAELAQSGVRGGRTLLTQFAPHIMAAFFHCSTLPPEAMHNTAMERTAELPDDASAVRVFVRSTSIAHGDRNNSPIRKHYHTHHRLSGHTSATMQSHPISERNGEYHDDVNHVSGDEDDDDDDDELTAVRRAIVWALSAMAVTCRAALLEELLPLVTAILAPSHPLAATAHQALQGEHAQLVEAALFLLAAVVEELFDDMDADFLVHIAQESGAAVCGGAYFVRHQAVRCIGRIASEWATRGHETAATSALEVLWGALRDGNKQVQLDAIRGMTQVVLAMLSRIRRNTESGNDSDIEGENGDAHGEEINGKNGQDGVNHNWQNGNKVWMPKPPPPPLVCLAAVLGNLLSAFPSMQLGARAELYRSLAQLVPLAIASPSLLDDTTALATLAALVRQGQQLAMQYINDHTTSTDAAMRKNKNYCSTQLELIALLGAVSDILVVSATEMAAAAAEPLAELGTALMYHCLTEQRAILPLSAPHAAIGSGSHGDNPNHSDVKSMTNSVDVCVLVMDLLDSCCDVVLSETSVLCDDASSRHGATVLQTSMLSVRAVAGDHAVGICLQLMEIPTITKEREICRAGFAFLSDALRFCHEVTIIERIYTVCLREVCQHSHDSSDNSNDGAVSNALMCLSVVFHQMAVGDDLELCELAAVLLWRLSSSFPNEKGAYMQTNAFCCAVSLAVRRPTAFKREGDIHTLLSMAHSLLRHMSLAEGLRTGMALAALLPQGAVVPLTLQNAMLAIASNAPPELSLKLQQQWGCV